MRTSFVLVDLENVLPSAAALLGNESYRLIVFVGENQTKIPIDLAMEIQKLGLRGEYVKVSGSGKNALDFHIALYIGLHSSQDSKACFHIISQDTGFDPLIKHLKHKKVSAARWAAIADIPEFKPSSTGTQAERLARLKEQISKMKAASPRTLKTLTSMTATHFGKTLSESEVANLIELLVKSKTISINGSKVTYL